MPAWYWDDGKVWCSMGLAEFERKKEEKIDGVIYDMSPSPNFKHGIINTNIRNERRLLMPGHHGYLRS